jgi:hypothetical protein
MKNAIGVNRLDRQRSFPSSAFYDRLDCVCYCSRDIELAVIDSALTLMPIEDISKAQPAVHQNKCHLKRPVVIVGALPSWGAPT